MNYNTAKERAAAMAPVKTEKPKPVKDVGYIIPVDYTREERRALGLTKRAPELFTGARRVRARSTGWDE